MHDCTHKRDRFLFQDALGITLDRIVSQPIHWGSKLIAAHLATLALGVCFLEERGDFSGLTANEDEYSRVLAEHKTPFQRKALLDLAASQVRDKTMKKIVLGTSREFDGALESLTTTEGRLKPIDCIKSFEKKWTKLILKTKGFYCDHVEAAVGTSGMELTRFFDGLCAQSKFSHREAKSKQGWKAMTRILWRACSDD